MKMGFKQIRTSDISGEVLSDEDVVTVVVKNEGKVFDCKADEIKSLKPLNGNIIELEIKRNGDEPQRILVADKDFYAVVPREVVEKADSSRGRRSGFRVS